jgi:hypothetical protein
MINKKGVSVMVSYILLIVIAVSLSAIVYGFLKLYIPKEKPECVDGINIIVQEAECINSKLELTLQNKGRFKIDAVFIRLGKQNREFREWINDPKVINDPTKFYLNGNKGLQPGDSIPINSLKVESIVDSDNFYTLEIQPAIFTGQGSIEDLALCKATTQIIDCKI